MNGPAMQRSAKWLRDQSERAYAEYQRVVWGYPAAPQQQARPTAAQALYPARRDTPRQTTRTQAAPNSIASIVYPHLPRGSR